MLPSPTPRARPAAPGRRAPALAALVTSLLAACGDGGAAGTVAGAGPSAVARERETSPAARELRAALDAGHAARAEELFATLTGRLGAEEPCLRARLAFLHGDETGWLRAIEAGRAAAPRDPRPYATAAELWAASGRLDAARAELERGVATMGELTPELERAKGVLALVTPGGTRVGLECLKRAVARDPGLPFVGRPFGQAHLLRAKGALADKDPELALEALDESLAFDPDDVEARELRAQALYAGQRFREAIEVYEALLADGRDVRGELATWHKNLGVLAQVAGDHGAARKHYLRGRELGLSDTELGSGVHFLREEARRAMLAGAALAAQGDDAGAAVQFVDASGLCADEAELRAECADELIARAVKAFGEQADRSQRAVALTAVEQAVALVADDRLSRVLRAKLYFAEGRFLEAADEFRWVIDDARAARIELPEPIHLHLSACHDVSGEREQAREDLREYLREEPTGRWLEETRERLRDLGE